MTQKLYNEVYEGDRNSHIAFPLGGMGAGMFCLEGTGALSHFSLRNTPDIRNEPLVFSAVCVKGKDGNIVRVLEGPVPTWKVFSSGADKFAGPGNGLSGKYYGLPRFADSTFQVRFPFGTVELRDPKMPVDVTITGWSPFIPLNADDSSLPAAALEFTFANTTDQLVELVYSFNAAHFMAAPDADNHRVLRADSGKGFVLDQPSVNDKPWEQGAFCAATDHPGAKVDCTWFRGGWFDPLTMIWNAIEAGQSQEKPPVEEGRPSPGASIFVPLELQPNEQQSVRLMLSWFVSETNLTAGEPAGSLQTGEDTNPSVPKYHKPWYAGKFADLSAVAEYWAHSYSRLREESERFTESFYSTALPTEAVEAVAANLAILKSPTVLRQTDGRLWGWEGCFDYGGSCQGTCTSVYGIMLNPFLICSRSLNEEFG